MKTENLEQIIKAKKILWNLYELPSDLTGQIDYIDFIVANKKIDERNRKEAIKKMA